MIPVLHPAQVRQSPDTLAFLEAEALLRHGDYVHGWPLYVQTHSSLSFMDSILIEWPGPHKSLKGKRILCIAEGGYGDNLYFMRWLHSLREWGADVYYLCPPSLASLARRQGFQAIENWQGNVDFHWDGFSYYTSLISLPHKFGVTLENYRWYGPYIDGGWQPWWRTYRVGFCWRAGEHAVQTKHRSLTVGELDTILESLPPTHRWVNLTYGTTESMAHNPPLTTWLDTARAIANLDLVISVDTGVAHLAAAMGVECWVILKEPSAWQYPVNRKFHPLYPSMRMFRSFGEVLAELEVI